MNQTLKPHGIILVGNASSDGLVDIARRFPVVQPLLSLKRNLVLANDISA